MAFDKVSQRTNDHVAVYSCLSADTRDTDGVFAGDICLVDNGDIEQYTGTQWIQTSSAGAASSATTSDSVWSYGNWPNTLYLNDSASVGATAVDNTVIYTSNDVSMYNFHIIENTSATDPVTVQVSIDGTNFSADASLRLINDVTTGGGVDVLTIPAAGFAVLDPVISKVRKIRVLKDGTTNEAPSIRYAHAVK